MFEKFKTRLKLKRAFKAVDKNDPEELLSCLDAGLDVNTKRLAQITDTDGTIYTSVLGFEETMSSRALREEKWDVLKALLERFGPAHLNMTECMSPSPPDILRRSVLRAPNQFEPTRLSWGDLRDKTFESSPGHFCLWHIARPDNQIQTTPVCANNGWEQDNPEGAKNLKTFFSNCAALEQKNALSKSVSETKEKKTEQKKPSAL